MGPFLPFRLWLADTTSSERLTFSAVIVAVAVVLAWSLPRVASTANRSASNASAVAGAATDGVTASTTSSASLDGGAGTGPSFNAATGARAPVGAGVASPAASSGGGSVDGREASGSGTAPTSGLTASDRGVTPTSVKLGFTILNVAGAQQAGLATNLRTDLPQVIDALVDNVNRHGGVDGRSIVADKKGVDILDANDQRAKCLDFTQTDGVFALLDFADFLYPATRACVTVEHKTPLLSWEPGSAAEVAAASPFAISLAKDDNRRVEDWIAAAKANGFFGGPGFHRLGVLMDNCEPSVISDPQTGLRAQLRKAGLTSYSEYTMDCDATSQERQAPQGAVQFNEAGVTNVLLATSGAAAQAFLNSAQVQGFRPKYFFGDYWNLTSDYNASTYNADQANGMVGVSQYNHGNPLSVPAIKACSDVLVAHGLKPITNFAVDLEAIVQCDNVNLFVKTADAAGPSLTRVGLGRALPLVGALSPGMEHAAAFRAGNSTADGTVALIAYAKACMCWVQKTPFHPAYA
jgi:hypothetical protein